MLFYSMSIAFAIAVSTRFLYYLNIRICTITFQIQKDMENRSSVFEENSSQLTHYKRELEGRNTQVKKLQKELDNTKEVIHVLNIQNTYKCGDRECNVYQTIYCGFRFVVFLYYE
jgi:hypothetical protein